jgi:hypothetical protein
VFDGTLSGLEFIERTVLWMPDPVSEEVPADLGILHGELAGRCPNCHAMGVEQRGELVGALKDCIRYDIAAPVPFVIPHLPNPVAV